MTTTIESVQTFKILIIGDSAVGKSSLMNRFVHGVFNINYTSTIGVDFKIATIQMGEYKCRLQIWDTAGQERFRSVTSGYYRGADGAIIVYDVTNRESFAQIRSRLSELEFHSDKNVPKILVGNKDDDNNQINKVILTHHARELAEENNLLFFETSVKDNKNITEVFNQLTKLVLQRRLHQSVRVENSISIKQKQPIRNKTNKWHCVL